MKTRNYQLMILELLLSAIFLTLWAGMVSGKIHHLSALWNREADYLHLDEQTFAIMGKTLIGNACSELVPSLRPPMAMEGGQNQGSWSGAPVSLSFQSGLALPLVKNLIRQELSPIQGYSIDYWNDISAIETSYSEKVPDYFLESDETNEEPKKKDPGSMPKTGSGKKYSMNKLRDRDYLLSHFYIVDETTSMSAGETDADRLLGADLSIPLKGKSPLVLIYHTHGSEEYRTAEGRKGTVIDVGKTLKKELEKTYHIPVIHDTTVYDQINGELDRSLAYNYAGDSVEAILDKNPSIQVVIDLHRDSISEHHRLVTEIDGKPTAQIMFFNGVSRKKGVGEIDYLTNPNKISNLAFSLQMQLLAARYYPGFTRKIYIKGYRYNLHLRKRATLVEVGAQNNSLAEAENAMKPLANILYRLLSGEKAVK